MSVFVCADSSFYSLSSRASARRRRLLLASTAALSIIAGPALAGPPISANGVDLGILTNVMVNAPPGNRAVIAYNPGGAVTLNGGDIQAQSTIANRSIGLLARTQGRINSSADITTTGDRGHAVQAGNSGPNPTLYDGSTAGTVNLTGGLIRTDGVYSLGLHSVDSGVINASNVTIRTTGATSFGGQSESMSTINLVDSSITTDGAAAIGLVANNDMLKNWNAQVAGGVISARNTTIATSGQLSLGVLSSHRANVTLEGGSVTTSGTGAIGLSAIIGGRISSSANIIATGVSAHAAMAGGAEASDSHALYDGSTAGTVTLTGGVLGVSGDNAKALYASDGGIIHATAITATASGAGSAGAHAASNSTINLNGSRVSTSSAGAPGLLADNQRLPIDAAATGGVINANNAIIATHGSGSHAVTAQDGGRITLFGGSVDAAGAGGHGVVASTTGRITSSADISAHGAQGAGAVAYNSGVVVLAGGTVAAHGADGWGLLAYNGGAIDSAANVATSGDRTHAVQAGAVAATASIFDGSSAGTVRLTGGAISASGVMAAGLYATDSGQIEAGPAAVTTTGIGSHGAVAQTGSRITLDRTSFETSGAGARGLFAGNDRRRDGIDPSAAGGVIRGHADVVTTGAGAHAALAEYGGRLELVGGSLTARGSGSAGLVARDGGVLVAENTRIVSEQDAAIHSHNNAVITLSGASAIVRGATSAIASTFDKPGQHVEIAIGPGVQLDSASGVLLAVDRSGAGGDSGVVALAVANNAVASGDILDTGVKTTGFTDVVLGEKATWSGVAKGVRHISALQGGGHLHFRDGSIITGDITASNATMVFGQGGVRLEGHLTLGNGSQTSGGSIGAPVHLGGNLEVDATSFLGGNWRVEGHLLNHGVIAPGNSLGVIDVGGNLTFGPSSIYMVDVNALNQSDLIRVAGQAHLDGRVVVAANPAGSGYVVGARQVIVSAAGGLGGTTFGGGASWAPGQSMVFLTPILGYDANNAYLTVTRNDTPMEDVAVTPNGSGAAAAVDKLSTDNPLFQIIANLPTAGAASEAFSAISGDVHASIAGTLVSQGLFVRDAVSGRIRQSFANGGGATASGDPRQVQRIEGLNAALWGQAFGGWGHAGGASIGVARVNNSLAGFLAGVDAQVFDGFRLGMAGGYGRSSIDVNNRASSASADSYHLALYGGGVFAGFGVRLGASYTWNDVNVSRAIVFPGYAASTRSDWRSGVAQAFGEIGRELRFDQSSVEPFLGLAWVGYDADRFQEGGGIAALSGKTASTSTLFSTLGARIAHRFMLANGAELTARGTVGWIHAFGDVNPRGRMWLHGSTTPFDVSGAPIARDSLLLEAGLDMNLAANVTLGATWSGQFAEHGQEQSLKGRFVMKF